MTSHPNKVKYLFTTPASNMNPNKPRRSLGLGKPKERSRLFESKLMTKQPSTKTKGSKFLFFN